MKIAFEYYGDLLKWREIYQKNQALIGDNASRLEPGLILKIDGREYVMVERNGKPYLIVRDDTLTKISKKVYGTPANWRELWQNNRQLIRHPDRIYAGLTLYYRDLESPGVATRLPAGTDPKPPQVRSESPGGGPPEPVTGSEEKAELLRRLKAHPARDP
jgi:hypothetical protein